MLKSRIVWALCIVGMLAFMVFSDEPVALVLFIVTVAVPIALIGINQIAARKLSVVVELPQTGEKNRQFVGRIRAENRQALPLAPIRCQLSCKNILTNEKMTPEVMFSLGSKAKDDVLFGLESRYCGCVCVSVATLSVYDIFGLVACNVPCESMEETAILPTTFSPHLTVMTHVAKDVEADEYSQEKAGFDPSETFAIREYRAGDSLHRIHWKLSGKFDEIVIREPSLPVRHSFLILLETSFLQETPPKAEVCDALTEIMMSLCQKMIEEQITYEVGWQDNENGGFFRSRIVNMQDLTGVAGKLLRVGYQSGGTDVLSSFEEAYGENKFEHVVYVSSFVPAYFEEFSGESQATGIICTQDAEAAEGMSDSSNRSLYFCSPENYEKDLFALTI
ncbi:MAG: DUF58 domain-containing protein [Christensenellales bacterium]|jgi:hypothetical protein